MLLFLYHDVPPCARCGSPRTGYFYPSGTDDGKETLRAMRRGEYAMPSPGGGYSCFCAECGVMWSGPVRVRPATWLEAARQREARGIGDDDEREAERFYREGRVPKGRLGKAAAKAARAAKDAAAAFLGKRGGW